MSVHNTPFGDIVDTEDDLQPLVASMFRDAVRAVALVAAAMQTAEFDAARLEARAAEGGTTSTELADTLVREHGVPFKTAHAIAARVLKAPARRPDGRSSDVLAGVAADARRAAALHRAKSCSDHEPAALRATCAGRWAGRRRSETARAPGAVAEALLDADRRVADRHAREALAAARAPAPRARRGALMDQMPRRPLRARDRRLSRHRRRGAGARCALWLVRRYFSSLTCMRRLDWLVVVSYLVWIVWDGLRRTKSSDKVEGYFLGEPEPAVVGRRAVGDGDAAAARSRWSARPGRATRDGMRFVQFYFGLPIAMMILSVTVVPFFYRAASTRRTSISSGGSTRRRARSRALLFLLRAACRAASSSAAPAVDAVGDARLEPAASPCW